MNKRLWELYAQSIIGVGESGSDVIDTEKFAELIIRECVEQIHSADVGELKAKSYYLDKIAEHIEKHFGVE